jgi:small subunit ribosomal protein S17
MAEKDTTTTARSSHRKVREGKVVSTKMDKTIVVQISRRISHPLYKKIITQYNKFIAHDEGNEAHEGDIVRIMETRPLSKTKRWRLVEVVKKGELALTASEAAESSSDNTKEA